MLAPLRWGGSGGAGGYGGAGVGPALVGRALAPSLLPPPVRPAAPAPTHSGAPTRIAGPPSRARRRVPQLNRFSSF